MSLDQLNTEQRAAVLAPESRVLVLAGAGSGKTRTLTERVAHLMENAASGYEIVCTTFTRAAAGEMRTRLEARIGREARKVTVSTFHGLGLGLLKRYGHHIGLRYGNLTVYTPLEMEVLLQHCGELLGLYAKGKWKHGKRELDTLFARVEQGEERESLADSPYYALFTAFETACRQNNALPYYGLIHGLAQLAADGKVREFTNWTYFLVDEVQDLDRMQWRALDAMLEHREGSALYAVGDISQSIYGFRGAVPEHLQALMDDHRLTVYELRKNYRSMPSIVRAANSLIRHNSHSRVEMEAVERNDSPAVDCKRNMDSAALADLLSADCWQGTGDTPREPGMTVAVLCRNNRMLDKLSSELTARGTSHLRIGRRTSDLHSPLFVKANALLKCIVNPYDETAFLLTHRALGVDAQTYADFGVRAATEGKSRFEVYLDAMGYSMLPTASSTVEEARRYFAMGNRYTFDPADGNAADYLNWLASYAQEHPCDSITDYLDWIALADVQDELSAPEERPGLVLMTCHAAKGLEFPYVVIAGCNEGVLPGKQAVTAERRGSPEVMEDERRIMYVAVTRAQRGLVLAVRPTGGKPPTNSGEPPSRFLAEMDIV